MSKIKSRVLAWAQAALALGGLALFFWMISKFGFDVIAENLTRFGTFPTLFLVLLYGLSQAAFAGGWHVLLKTQEPSIEFWPVFRAYAAGDAMNMSIPSANLAGEPIKVMLIRDRISFQTAMSSVTVYKYSDILSMTIFLLAGWLFQFGFYSLPLSWNVGGGVIAVGMAVFCFILYELQHRGIYEPASRWLNKIKLGWVMSKFESAHLVDAEITSYYQNHPGKFWLSVFLNVLAWFGGVVEILIFMKVAGIPVSFPAAFTIETFALFINNVVFFVPARLGVAEGGRILLFMTLGYAPQAGMLYGIIRRIRELAWVGAGYLILLLNWKKAHPTEGLSDSPTSSLNHK